MIKRYITMLMLLLPLLFPATLFAKGVTLTDHAKITELSSFCIMGEHELRTEKSIESEVMFRTLNHEGGMKVRVLEILDHDEYKGESWLWLYVLLTAPMWVSTGEWIEKYQKFLIFLPNQTPVFDFEE